MQHAPTPMEALIVIAIQVSLVMDQRAMILMSAKWTHTIVILMQHVSTPMEVSPVIALMIITALLRYARASTSQHFAALHQCAKLWILVSLALLCM